MKKRVYSSIFIVVLLAMLFVLKIFVADWGAYFFDAFFGVLACIAAYETSRLLSKAKRYNFQIIGVIFPAVILTVNLLCIFYGNANAGLYYVLWAILINVAIMLAVVLVAFLVQLLSKKRSISEMKAREITNTSVAKFAFKKALNTLILLVYPGFFFLFMIFVNHINLLPLGKLSDVGADFSVFVLLTALLIPMLEDTFAMLTGSVIGGKKLCPKISPNKTISGAIGGVLWPMLLLSCVYLIFSNISTYGFLTESFPIWGYLIIVFIGTIIAILGDLFESILKRRAGVSDSGKLIPGHGGLLDRIDSYIYIAPYILLAFLIFAF